MPNPNARRISTVEPRAVVSTAYGLCERQREFAAAILDPDKPVPAGLVGPHGEASARRFAVYRNNVIASLVEVLKAAFPAVRRIVGEDFFAAMARIYVMQYPPRSPILLDYGAEFASFIGTFEPAAELPYLQDVARLERAWLEAYHAAEAHPINPVALCEIRSGQLSHACFVLHPSVRAVQSRFPIVTIWLMNVNGGTPTALAVETGSEHALVARPNAEVAVRSVSPGAAVFVQALATGIPVVDAATVAFGNDAESDLASALEGLLEAGLIVGWRLNGNAHRSAAGRLA